MKKMSNTTQVRLTNFNKLVGKTISEVDAQSINQVVLTDTEGNQYIIVAEPNILGIPLITLE